MRRFARVVVYEEEPPVGGDNQWARRGSATVEVAIVRMRSPT